MRDTLVMYLKSYLRVTRCGFSSSSKARVKNKKLRTMHYGMASILSVRYTNEMVEHQESFVLRLIQRYQSVDKVSDSGPVSRLDTCIIYKNVS